MTALPESIASTLASPLAVSQNDQDGPSKGMANLLDGEAAERARSLIRTLSSLTRDPVLVAANDQKQWCYMIITPSLDTEGITAFHPPKQQWFIKFGDGDPDVSGRYKTHNPSFNVEVNETGRRGTLLKNKVFAERGFKLAGASSEWFVLRTGKNIRDDLQKLLNQFSSVKLDDGRKEEEFIREANKILKREYGRF